MPDHRDWRVPVLAVALLVPALPAIGTAQPGFASIPPMFAASGDAAAPCNGRTLHPPIVIRGDAMFQLGPAVGVTNPSANGTAEDPYLIEGWCILPDAASDLSVIDPASIPGIGIEGTDAHVVIGDNAIPGGYDRGLRLEGASNVTLAGNWIARNDVGVFLDESNATVIANNTVTDNRFDGVDIRRSNGAIVVNNTVTDNGLDGVELRRSNGARITDNTITDNRAGIELRGSSGATVQDNVLDGDGLIISGDRLAHYHHSIDASNTDDGEPIRYVRDRVGVDVPAPAAQVILANTTGARVDGLELSNTSAGLLGGFTWNTTVTNSTISDNDQDGIDLHRSTGARIANNTVADNRFDGVDISSSTGVRVAHNTIEDTGIDSVRIQDSSDAVIARNTITSSGDDGVILIGSDGARIAHNTVTENGNRGLFLWDSGDARVVDNTIEANGDDGVLLWESTGARIESNIIQSNDAEGVFLDASDGARIENNTIAGNRFRGVILFASDRTRIADNTVTGNAHDGVFFWASSSARLADNHIQDNGDAGLVVWGGSEPVDATGNWWGAADGPSGGATDACTGEVADGTGDAIDTDNETLFGEDGEVCFDPWRTSPNPDAGAS